MSKNVDEAISRKEGKRVMSYIPNMITIANFVCGLLAIYAVFVHDIYLGAVFIITGMLFDFLDGMVARKLDSVSEIGGTSNRGILDGSLFISSCSTNFSNG